MELCTCKDITGEVESGPGMTEAEVKYSTYILYFNSSVFLVD
jgi:hypothetical protein